MKGKNFAQLEGRRGIEGKNLREDEREKA